MVENGPAVLYDIKPLYDFNPKLELPDCMYKVKSIYDDGDCCSSVINTQVDAMSSGSETEKYELEVLHKLEDLRTQVLKLKKELNISPNGGSETEQVMLTEPQDIVIKADPDYPPYSVWVFRRILQERMKMQLATYIHSSLDCIPESLKCLNETKSDGTFDVTLTVIWKKAGRDAEMMIDPINQGIIEGEVNIARYLGRLLSLGYDVDPYISLQIDYWLETAHVSVVHGSNKERSAALKSMNSHLAKSSHLVGNAVSLADVVMWSSILQCKLNQNLPDHVSRWWNILNGQSEFKIISFS